MADRTVSVRLQAQVTDYMAKMSAASKATAGLAREVDIAKGRAAQGFHAMGVAGVAAGTVVAGGFLLAVKSAADFQAKMALVRTLSHASAGEMTQLSDAALHVGQAYGFSAGQVADAEAELVKAGVSVKDIMGGALAGALTLAAAGQTDVAEATTIAATAMTQFQLSGKDVPHIADLLAAGADKALGSVGDLGYALDQAGPQAHQFHVSIEETIGTLAAFAQAGQVGERGGTVFSQMLLKLAAPGKQSAQILKDLGISIYDVNGKFVGMAGLAGQLQSKMSGLTEAQRNSDLAILFGSRAIRGANILYQEGAKGIADWTAAVNDQGFAALQASGKLDSLSGDVTKLKTALQTAFIGAGEGSQGPLRTMVQDITSAVEAWNQLPGPVRDAAEALTLAAGAVAFAGGAALLFIPKWTAMNASLVATGRSAITARTALSTLGKTGVFVAGVAAAYEALHQLDNALKPVPPSANAVTDSLITLSQTGKYTGALSDLSKNISSVLKTFTDIPSGSLSRELDAVDKSLADLASTGHVDVAKAAFDQLSSSMRAGGLTADQVNKHFPLLSAALATLATQARLTGDNVDKAGNQIGGAGKQTRSATQAAKAYGKALHALADPLFGMNQSLQGVVDAQKAVNQAIHKYGSDSPQAKQANLDLASAALDAEAAARTLAASVRDGTTSLHDARAQLRGWVQDGLLTKQSADNVIKSFGYLIDKANAISGLHPHMTVTADTSQPEAALSNLIARIGQTISGFLTLGGVTVTGSGAHTTGPGSNPVGYQAPGSQGGGGHHHSGGHSGGATVNVPSPSTDGYYVPSSSGGGGGSGGSGGGSGGSGSKAAKQRPPTVQEIVQAILTGTIPPSIDQLSKVLQHEIGHLSTVVGNAGQYRSTVRSSLLGYASISNATAPTDAYGRTMGPVKVNAYLKGRLSQLKQFVHLRHRLEHMGAGQGLLQEFEEIGPDANAEMRQLLAGGTKAVQRANRLEHRIRRLSTDAAGEAATDRYGKQIVHELSQLPPHMAHAIIKGLRHEHIDVSLKDVAHHRGRRVRSKS